MAGFILALAVVLMIGGAVWWQTSACRSWPATWAVWTTAVFAGFLMIAWGRGELSPGVAMACALLAPVIAALVILWDFWRHRDDRVKRG